MRVRSLETRIANAGLRNYVFVLLTADDGSTGVGEASLEWQERAVQTLIHEWAEQYVIGSSPLEIEATASRMIRDQYQGGSTVMTAISAVEIAMWDLLGKHLNKPIYQLLGGRVHRSLPAYANGWYGGIDTPEEYAQRAAEAISRGYQGVKFDPFGAAWKRLTPKEFSAAVDRVAAVRRAIGRAKKMMIEFHGRLSYRSALDMIRAIAPYDPFWCEEPVAPELVEQLVNLRKNCDVPIAAGERNYTLPDFYRLMNLGAVDYVQLDVSHCGGLLAARKVAHVAEALDIGIAPHCSVGPVALAAALQFDAGVQNFVIQESFSEYDVPWRSELVGGWEPCVGGEFAVPDEPGLGVGLNDDAFSEHPYVAHSFPSLWSTTWTDNFTQNESR